MSARSLTVLIGLASLAVLPMISAISDGPYYVDLFTRILIFAIAAVSLDLILGFGGMISFGHAAYLGIGAYTIGILSVGGLTNGFVQFGSAIATSALAALCIGLVSLRTSGAQFIMITLAFSQMIYFLGISLTAYGGDDGLTIPARSDFGKLLDLGNPIIRYYAVFAVLLVVLEACRRIVGSRFGMVIRGTKANERRMIAMGYRTFRYKLTAFVISGAMCGVAGALFANQQLFISPSIMHWSRSGELMIMVLLGGVGTLAGPVLGATVFLVFEDLLSNVTTHWQVIFGPLLVLVVLFAPHGLLGLVTRKLIRVGPRKSVPLVVHGG